MVQPHTQLFPPSLLFFLISIGIYGPYKVLGEIHTIVRVDLKLSNYFCPLIIKKYLNVNSDIWVH